MTKNLVQEKIASVWVYKLGQVPQAVFAPESTSVALSVVAIVI